MYNRIFETVKVDKVAAASAAGQTEVNSSVVDLAEYDGVAFIVSAGTITSGGAQSVKIEIGNESNLSDATASGVAITIADDDDNQTFLLDYIKNDYRYARLTILRATQNSAFGEIYAMRYGATITPVVNAVTDTLTVDTN